MSDGNKEKSKEGEVNMETLRKICKYDNKIEYLKILHRDINRCISEKDIFLIGICLPPCIDDINHEIFELAIKINNDMQALYPLIWRQKFDFEARMFAMISSLTSKYEFSPNIGNIIINNFEKWIDEFKNDIERYTFFIYIISKIIDSGEYEYILYIFNTFINHIYTHKYKIYALLNIVDFLSESDQGIYFLKKILRLDLLNDERYAIILLEKIFYNYKNNFNEKISIALEILNNVKSLEYFTKCICLILRFIYVNYSENKVNFNDIKNTLYDLKYIIERKIGIVPEIQPTVIESREEPRIRVHAPSEIRWGECGILKVEVEGSGKVVIDFDDLMSFFDVRMGDESISKFEINFGSGKRVIEFELIPKYKGKFDGEIIVRFEGRERRIPVSIRVAYIDVGVFPLHSKYEPIRLIGEGLTSYVWKCKRRSDDVLVAVKLFKESKEADESFVEEIASWKRLKHLYVVELYDYAIRPHPHVEMELCDCSLENVRMDVLELAKTLADVLDYAHGKGIVHGDLKPSNILLKDGVIKVCDWGIGYTPAYAPPEVLEGAEPDEKADIWSFGVVLYEQITGMNPFLGKDDIETHKNILKLEPDFSNLGVLGEIIGRCLRKDPNERYRSFKELKRDLAEISISVYSRRFSSSRDESERVRNAINIAESYELAGDFESARNKYIDARDLTTNSKAQKIFEAMCKHEEIYEICVHEKNFVKSDIIWSKFESMFEFLDDDLRRRIENDPYAGIRLERLKLYSAEYLSQEQIEEIRNVILPRIRDIIRKNLVL